MNNDEVIQNIENEAKKYLPSASSLARAAVSVIPYIGGALDHLIFDKSNEIQRKNIFQSLEIVK